MANDTIGSLVAVTTVTASKFTAGMKEIEQSLDQTHAHAASLDWGAAFKLDAAFELIRQGVEKAEEAIDGFFESIERIGQLKNFSQAVGASTQEIQGLHYAAQQFHIDSQQLDTALQRMQKTIGEMNAGQSPALVKTFQQLGLSMRDFAGLDAEQSFLKIGDAIKKLGNSADEAYAATTIFGRGSENLIAMFNEGSESIRGYIAEAQKAGIILSTEDVEAAEQAERALANLKSQWETFIDHLVAAASPELIAIAGELKEIGEYLTKHADEVVRAAIGWAKIAADIGAALIIIPQVASAIGMVVEALREMSISEAIVESLGGPVGIGSLIAGGLAAAVAIGMINDQFDGMQTSAAAAMEQIKQATEEAKKAAGSGGPSSLAASQKQAADDAKWAKEMEEVGKKAQQAMDEMYEHGRKIAEEMRTPMEKYNDTIRELLSLLRQGAIDMEMFRRASAKAQADLDKLKGRHELGEDPHIAGADISTSAGASLDIAAGRFSQDLANQKQELAQEQLEQAQQQTQLQQQMLDVLMSPAGQESLPAIADF